MRRPAQTMMTRVCERLSKTSLSTLAIVFARLLQNANGFLLTAVTAHLYGFDAVGTLTLATIPNTFVALFGTFGLHFRFAQIDAADAVRNSLGLIAAVLSFPVIFVLSLAFGFTFGHSESEQFQLIILALSSPFFAQTNVTSALQVLQNKQAQSLIAPGMNSLGLLAGIFSADFTGFCLCLFVFRLVGIAVPYMLLPHDFSALRTVPGQLRAGVSYLFSDAVLVVGDNLVLLLSAHLLGRSDLGILGICRQLLTASDTPGWASLQSVYPKLVAEGHDYFRGLFGSMLRLGLVLGALVAVMAWPAGRLVFNLPELWFYAAIVMVCVPARYVIVCVETFLKAKQAIRFANRLTAVRAVAGFCVVGAATYAGGLLGHLLAVSVFSIAFALVESMMTMQDRSLPRPVAEVSAP